MSERDSICASEEKPDSKRCAKCGCTKPFSNFYRNKGTSDGFGSWCRDCEKARSRAGYTEAYRQTDGYSQAQRKYRSSSRGKKAIAEYTTEARKKNLVKVVAREVVNSAKRHRKIVPPTECQRCGLATKLQAHHPDYSQPLMVDWLCPKCHAQADRELRALDV